MTSGAHLLALTPGGFSLANEILLAVVAGFTLANTWISRHTKRDVGEAKENAHKARQVAEDTNRQVTPSNGRTTAHTVEEVLSEVRELREEMGDLRADNAGIGSALALHLVDDHEHDPIRKMTRRQNRRLDDPKEY